MNWDAKNPVQMFKFGCALYYSMAKFGHGIVQCASQDSNRNSSSTLVPVRIQIGTSKYTCISQDSNGHFTSTLVLVRIKISTSQVHLFRSGFKQAHKYTYAG